MLASLSHQVNLEPLPSLGVAEAPGFGAAARGGHAVEILRRRFGLARIDHKA